MFGFWKRGPKKSPKEDRPRPAPVPPLAPGKAAPARRSRVIDVPGLFRQAGQRIGIKQLLRMGKKDITLLSREKIDALINRSVKAAVSKHVSSGAITDAALFRIQEDSRAQFAELLRKAKFTANISDDPTRDLLKLIKSFTTHVPAPKGPRLEAQGPDRSVVPFSEIDLEPGRGLDVGTVNICAGARKKGGGAVFNLQRSAFLDFRDDPLTQSLLTRFGVDFIPHDGKTHVIGDPAFDLANLFEKPVQRALKDGTLSREEPGALFVVNCLVTQLLGRPQTAGEVCVYSVPAEAADADRSFIYHRAALEIMIKNLGYTPKPMLESHLIVFAELKDQAYTGIGISCGGGMFNVCVSYKGVPAVTFSTSRGGDWIDESVADSLGLPVPVVTAVKEGGMDLRRPKGRIEEAIAIYYKHLLQYTLETMREKMGSSGTMPNFKEPVEVVCSGGTALAKGFVDLFEDEFKRSGLPVRISGIRNAADPLKAVTAGCVQAALEEMRAPGQAGVQVAEAALRRSAAGEVQKVDEEARRRLEAIHRPPPAMGRQAPAVVQKVDENVRRRLEAVQRPSAPPERDAAAVVQKVDEDVRRRLEAVQRPPAPPERDPAAVVQKVDEDVRRRLEAAQQAPAPTGRDAAAVVQKVDENVRRRLEAVQQPPAPLERDAAAVVEKADDEVRRRLEAVQQPQPPPEREAPIVVPKTWQTHNGKVSPGPAV